MAVTEQPEALQFSLPPGVEEEVPFREMAAVIGRRISRARRGRPITS